MIYSELSAPRNWFMEAETTMLRAKLEIATPFIAFCIGCPILASDFDNPSFNNCF
jgi:hypothetical protein